MKKTGNKSYLLDTNIVIDLLKGEHRIADEINGAKSVYLPVFALGELYLGVENSGRRKYHKRQIESFLKFVIVLNTSALIASIYGNLKSFLKGRGTPIPENDIWIAALAKEFGLPIVTHDAHFLNFDDIEVISW